MKLIIKRDPDASSPRIDRDNLGTLYIPPRGPIDGDKGATDPIQLRCACDVWGYMPDHPICSECETQVIAKLKPNLIGLPVYAYQHGGITIRTNAFSCPWDSGMIGFIYVTREKLVAEQLADRPDIEIAEYLQSEIKTLDQWLQGDVWGFELQGDEGNEVDSCWGFYGDDWKTNGIRDHVDVSEITEVEYQELVTRSVSTYETIRKEKP